MLTYSFFLVDRSSCTWAWLGGSEVFLTERPDACLPWLSWDLLWPSTRISRKKSWVRQLAAISFSGWIAWCRALVGLMKFPCASVCLLKTNFGRAILEFKKIDMLACMIDLHTHRPGGAGVWSVHLHLWKACACDQGDGWALQYAMRWSEATWFWELASTRWRAGHLMRAFWGTMSGRNCIFWATWYTITSLEIHATWRVFWTKISWLEQKGWQNLATQCTWASRSRFDMRCTFLWRWAA